MTRRFVLLLTATALLCLGTWPLMAAVPGPERGRTPWTLDGDSGTPETVDPTNTATIAGGTGISTVVGATDTVTVNCDSAGAAVTGCVNTGAQTFSGTKTFDDDAFFGDSYDGSGHFSVVKISPSATMSGGYGLRGYSFEPVITATTLANTFTAMYSGGTITRSAATCQFCFLFTFWNKQISLSNTASQPPVPPVVFLDQGQIQAGNGVNVGTVTSMASISANHTIGTIGATGSTITVTDYFGYEFKPKITTSNAGHTATITTGTGVNCKPVTVDGAGSETLTNYHCLNVPDIDTAPVTTAMSLRSLGSTVQMRHAGPVEIGATDGPATNAELDVVGDGIFTTSLAIGQATVATSGIELEVVGDATISVSLKIPVGTAPTIANSGEIGIDTDGDQFVFQSGTADFVLEPEHTKCRVFMAGTLDSGTDDELFFSPGENITLQDAWCHCHGGSCGVEADVSFETVQVGTAGPTVDDVTGTVDCEDEVAGDTKTALSGDGATVDAIDTVRLDTDNNPTNGGDYIVCLTYTVDQG